MATKTNDQMDRSFLQASVPELVKKLRLEEKIGLLAGQGWWETVPVPRLNIPSIKVTDGPNGARGGSFFKMTPATAIPNATALGATFDDELVGEAGKLLAAETKARNAVCLLAPTINIQRSPLGGRAFESFSEDPTHSGLTAAAYVNGLQGEGVSATIKHFVANDQEHERNGEDSIIAQRPLREVYLRPFQIAQKLAQPRAYMTSYNKLNGTHCSENPWLLGDLLRKEWGHKGLIMSDWYGTYSVSESINAGMNLEMPGPARWRAQELVQHLVRAHKINERQIDKIAGELLQWVQDLARENEDLVYAKPSEERTRSEDKDKDAKLVRKLGADAIVLLKNDKEVLPLAADKSKRIAVIGPNAKARVLTGGGSAQLRSAWAQTPWEGLEANKPNGVELEYALGASTEKFLPLLNEDFTAEDGSPGFDLRHYSIVDGKMADKPAVEEKFDTSMLFMADFFHKDLCRPWFTELKAVFTSPIDGEYEFGLAVTGAGWLWIDDELVIDISTYLPRGSVFFGSATDEIKAKIKVQKGKTYKLRVLHDGRIPTNDEGNSTPLLVTGVRVGAFRSFDADEEIAAAAKLAAECDTAVVVTGLNADWESEGYDRPNLSLPLRTDELVAAVAKANPNTVVVIQAGSAVSMPWADNVAGIVQAWYGGNETGNAIADVLYGKVNPAGRLPVSFPKREADIAASQNYKSARTKIYYEEGIWVGYKHHNARQIAPLFPFGHGLSYTTFGYTDLKLAKAPPADCKSADEWKCTVEVTVTNTGSVTGSHSVHFYTCPPEEKPSGLRHPSHALQAYTKVHDLAPGKSKTVQVTLDKYAISHWDELYDTWRVEQGEWAVKVGINAQNLVGEAKFSVEQDLEWRGL